MALPRSVRALGNRNYRLFLIGQVISVAGTWAQTIGLGWLVLDLSDDSGVAVGIVTAAQFIPVLLFGLLAGMMADRFDKRRLFLTTQVNLALLALVLALVDLTDVVTLPMVYILAFLFGAVTACDNPVRLSFVVEMVGPTDLPNALALNSAVFNAGRILGPALAGFMILAGGTGLCFLVNAVSYIGTIIAVVSMRRADLHQPVPVRRGKGQVREGLRYAWNTPLLRDDLVLLATVSVLAFNFPVVLPLLAKLTFHGDAGTYSVLAAAMGVGALLSAGVMASVGRPHGRRIVLAVAALAVGLIAGSLSPNLTMLIVVLTLVGAGQVTTASGANALVQLDAEPAMRGRVSAMFTLANQGATPFSGLLAGFVAQAAGPRWAMGLGGVGALVAVALLGRRLFDDHAAAPSRVAATATSPERRPAVDARPACSAAAEEPSQVSQVVFLQSDTGE